MITSSTDIPDRGSIKVFVTMLGRFQIDVGSTEQASTTQMRGYGGRLFAYLACHIGEKVDRQKVLRDIWPTATDEQARKRFHVALHELRQCLSHVMLSLKNMVENDRISIGLSSHWLIESDLNVLKMSRQHLETFPIERVDQLLDSIKGEFLAGETVVPWIDVVRRAAQSDRLRLLVRKGQLLLASAQFRQASLCAGQALTISSVSEEACIVMMQAQYQLGNREAAITAYDALRRALSDNLDMKASMQIQDLASQIRACAPPNSHIVVEQDQSDIISSAQGKLFGMSVVDDRETKKTPVIRQKSFSSEQSNWASDLTAGRLFAIITKQEHSLVCLCGPPGQGKSTILRQVLSQLAALPTFKTRLISDVKAVEQHDHRLFTVAQIDRQVQGVQPGKLVVIIDVVANEEHLRQFIEAIRFQFPNALVIFVAERSTKIRGSLLVRVPSLEIWNHPDARANHTQAVTVFCEMIALQGLSKTLNLYPSKTLEALCRYSGGNPGILSEASERFEKCPLPLLGETLNLIARSDELCQESANDFTFRFGQFIRDSVLRQLSKNESQILATLRSLDSPLSLYGISGLHQLDRVTALAALDRLADLGLVTIFRSRKFDVVFAHVSGFVSDVLEAVGFAKMTEHDRVNLVNFFSRIQLPREKQNLQSVALLKEVLSYEHRWVEAALEFAQKSSMAREGVRLSSVLRSFFFNTGNLGSAQRFFNRMLDIATDPRDAIDFHTVLGALYERAGYRFAAQRHLICALTKARPTQLNFRIASIRHSLSAVAFNAGKTARGEALLKAAIAGYVECAVAPQLPLAASTGAMALINALRLDDAASLLNRYKPVDATGENQSAQAWHLARAYLAFFKGEASVALAYLKTSQQLGRHLEYVQAVFKTALLQASMCLADRNAQQCKAILQPAVRQMISADFKADAVHGLALCAMANQLDGDESEAKLCLSEALSLLEFISDGEAEGLVAYAMILIDKLANDAPYEDRIAEALQNGFARFPSYVKLAIINESAYLDTILGQSFLAKDRASLALKTLPPMLLVMSEFKEKHFEWHPISH